MNNLDNIINEKKTKLEVIASKFFDAISAEDRDYNCAVEKLKKTLNKSVEEITRKKAITMANVNEQYSNAISKTLIDNLTADYNTIVERASYTAVSKETLGKVSSVKKTLSKIKDKNALNDLLDVLPVDIKNLLDVPRIEDMAKPKEITTYVFANGEGCYMLTPITDDDSSILAKNLTDKIIGVLNLGRVSTDSAHGVSFQASEPLYTQGFLMFKLETPHSQYLAKELTAKFSDTNIQPKSFQEHNLTHKVKCLDYEIIKNFMNYTASDETQHTAKRGRPFKNKEISDTIKSTNTSTSENGTSTVRSKIIHKYADPKKVIEAYNAINEGYKARAGHDLGMSDIVNCRIDGKSGWTLYYALKEHLTKGTIKADEIASSTNLSKYSK